MKAKRLVSFVAASAMLVSMVAPALATTLDEATNRLNGVGVITGYTDGSFKPEQNITRAEFAAIAVRAMGMEGAAAAANGSTKFKDVTSSNWASGYVNVAVDQGIIVGYPDKTFKPNANVTSAEAIAMVVRVLGYEPVLTGSWPTKYISKASTIGILDDVNITSYNSAATRGNVFLITDSALDAHVLHQYGYGDLKTYEEISSLLVEKMKIAEAKDVMIGASVVDDGVAIDEVLIGGAKKDLATTASINPFNVYGINHTAYMSKDSNNEYKKVLAVKADEEEIFTDKIKSIDTVNNKITFVTRGEETMATGANVYEDFADTGATAVLGTNLQAGDVVKVVMNDRDKMSKFILFSYPNQDYVKEVNAADKKLTFKISGNSITLKDVDEDFIQIFKNGKKATFADIKAGDVVSYTKTSDDKYLIAATDATVTGKLVSVADACTNTAVKLVVGDKTVYSYGAFKYSTDSEDSWTPGTTADLNDDLVGQTVTVKLGLNGQAAYVISGAQAVSNNNDVYVRNIVKDTSVTGNTNSDVIYLKVTKMDGTMVVYEVDQDDYTTTAGTSDLDLKNGATTIATPESFVRVTLNAAGKVTKVTALPSTFIQGTISNTNADADTFKVNGNTYIVTSDTKVLKVKEWGDGTKGSVNPGYINETETASWNNAEDIANGGWAVIDNNKVKYVFISSTAVAASDYKYGVVVGAKFGIGGGDFAAKINENGTETDYTLDLSDSVANFTYSNEPLFFKLSADGKKITSVSQIAAEGVVKTVSSTETVGDKFIIKYTDNTSSIGYAAKIKMFDKSAGKTITAITSLSTNDKVKVYDLLDTDGNFVAPGGTKTKDGLVDYVVKE